MLKNYLKIAWRNILRNKLRTSIHVLGLAIGIAVCFVIFNVISFSYSFDRFHSNKDHIFQITTLTTYGDQSWPNSGVPSPLGEAVKYELVGVAEAAHFYTMHNTLVLLPDGNKNLGRSNQVILSDPSFFKIFEREWLAGNSALALEQPHAVVLTESSMQKYFPGQDPTAVLGKEILYLERDSLITVVTGIVKDYSENTDFTFTDFISTSTLMTLKGNSLESSQDQWATVDSNSQLFVLLEENWTDEEVEAGLAGIVDKYIHLEEGRNTQFFIQPLSELHFTHPYTTQRAVKMVLKGLMIIGIILLVTACLNFINLETAQAINRSKEVGIRKSMGSSKGQLIQQFLTETYLLVGLAIGVSFILTELTVSYFSDYLPGGMQIHFLSFENVLFLLGLSVVLTFLSGIYPAFILGNYQPDLAIRGDLKDHRGFSFGFFLRKNLTVIQFTLSIAFIISVLAITKQINFLNSQELGFDKESLMYARAPYLDPSTEATNLPIKERLEQESFVQGVSLSSDMVASSGLWTTLIGFTHLDQKKEHEVQAKTIDEDFVKVNGLKLLAGRNLREIPNEVLINETASLSLGFQNPENILGEVLEYDDRELLVVGVVKDFHSRSLRESFLPMIMFYEVFPYQTINVRLEPGTLPMQAKLALDHIYKEHYPLESGSFVFLDETISRFYQDDAKMQEILAFASGMAILISCMGLFGLTLFTISKRLKELSIRKVLGASVNQILLLVSKEYVLLIFIAFVFGSIPAYLFLDSWLQTFSYRIDLPWELFAIAGTVALMLCLLIVGFHSVRAANENPAEILKCE
ncbi:ABC transporter permease [Pararhodonellum marinum]|uniref:ABC transporter permease n=1 Tax=Pararhodonellum marinum TaxID=2755358 RepID=UPI0018902A03|nr:ABC transporter permease [Pararhodonellum marinum]